MSGNRHHLPELVIELIAEALNSTWSNETAGIRTELNENLIPNGTTIKRYCGPYNRSSKQVEPYQLPAAIAARDVHSATDALSADLAMFLRRCVKQRGRPSLIRHSPVICAVAADGYETHPDCLVWIVYAEFVHETKRRTFANAKE